MMKFRHPEDCVCVFGHFSGLIFAGQTPILRKIIPFQDIKNALNERFFDCHAMKLNPGMNYRNFLAECDSNPGKKS